MNFVLGAGIDVAGMDSIRVSTLKWACSTTFEKDSATQSSHRNQPKYTQFQSVGIKDKLNTRTLQLAQLTPTS